MKLSAHVSTLLVKSFIFEKTVLQSFADANVGTEVSFYQALTELVSGTHSISLSDINDWLKANTNIGKVFNQTWKINPQSISSSIGNGSIAWISNNYNHPKGENVSQSSLLKPTSKIPALWFWISSLDTKAPLDKDLAHDAFIVESLSKITLQPMQSSSFLHDVKLFIEQNKDKINKLRSLFQNIPRRLGVGENTSDGVAFSIGPNMVLKIFKSKLAFEKATAAMERLHKNPMLAKTEAMIYDTGILGEFDDKMIFYYIMEKMVPVRKLNPELETYLQSIRSFILDYIDDNKNYWDDLKPLVNDPASANKIKSLVDRGANHISNYIKSSGIDESIEEIEKLVKLKSNWIKLLAEEMLMKYITGRTDLHLGNLGVTNYGEFRYFDPAYG